MSTSAVRYDKDIEGIVTLTLDDPAQSTNTMNAHYREGMGHAVARLQEEGEHVAGVIVTSAKKTFFAGGDLNEIVRLTPETAPDFIAHVRAIKQQLRALETLGKPVVAVIAGAALGGGLEIALAAHCRIAVDNPRVVLGFPEVTLGLLPGAGGIVRSVRLLGLEKALSLLTEGRQLKPAEARDRGLVHELALSSGAALEQARAWIRRNPRVVQPWDIEGYSIPGGAPSHPAVAQTLPIAPSAVRAKSHGNLPAPEAILSSAVEGALVSFDAAQKVEERYFAHLLCHPVSKNLIKTFWFQLNAVKSGGARPKEPQPSQFKQLDIVGAGMKGSGMVHVSALGGIEAVLKDVNDALHCYTARVFLAFVDEGLRLLAEGVSAAMIENLSVHAGMPLGPLEASDAISLTVLQNIHKQTEADRADGGKSPERTVHDVMDRMVGEFKRPGRAAGAGFYEYSADRKQRLWPQLGKHFHNGSVDLPRADVRDRFLLIQALEAVRALDEGIVSCVAAANIGGIFGAGYPAWTGGPLQFIDYCGAAAFVERSRNLAERYGARFNPQERLLRMATNGERFSDP